MSDNETRLQASTATPPQEDGQPKEQSISRKNIPVAKLFDPTHAHETTPEELVKLQMGSKEEYEKYLVMEQSIKQELVAMTDNIGQLTEALTVVEGLEQTQEEALIYHFKLTETISAKSRIKCGKSVFLWLGADSLLEYSLQEARELLQKNCNGLKTKIVELKNELDHVKKQVVTCELNRALSHSYISKVSQSQPVQAS